MLEYILKTIPNDILTDIHFKLSCIEPRINYLHKPTVFSFSLKILHQALNDIEVYHLLYSIIEQCEPTVEDWLRELADVQKTRQIILEFERLVDMYLYVPTANNKAVVEKFIRQNSQVTDELVSRLKVFNALYGTEVIPLAIGGNSDKLQGNTLIKSHLYVSVPALAEMVKKLHNIRLFELQLDLIEHSLWEKQIEIELPIPLCQLEPLEGDPKEILMYLRTGNPTCVVRLSACLISIICKKEQNKWQETQNEIEATWLQTYVQLFQDLAFEQVPMEESRSAHALFRYAACLIQCRIQLDFTLPSTLFQRAWDHFYMQRSIYMKSLADQAKLDRAKRDLILLENVVFTSLLSPHWTEGGKAL
ncbi:hypothetical protein BCV72DRAFT_61120 [Rhizopus microsporus var. microsporus]|uniref:Uncharacterized protein n=1 Tax=Rhizopus microsporus var. microsporus TaxID=86635 RepID=A0A1X0RC75_RHIZD|nr:hypothetical protein BCV72DRAFT_61120 [Rhizopus microsporus var. microsporus]